MFFMFVVYMDKGEGNLLLLGGGTACVILIFIFIKIYFLTIHTLVKFIMPRGETQEKVFPGFIHRIH